jgi:hypothetical protein
MKDNYRINDQLSMGAGKGLAEEFNPKVNVKLQLFDREGNLKETREIHNTMTNAGKYGIMDQIASTPSLAIANYMEVGTGTGGTTKLNAYISGSRTACTSRTRTNNAVAIVCTFGAGVGTGAVTEAGMFDVATQDSPNMWCYSSFAVINKGALDSLQITWTITGS